MARTRTRPTRQDTIDQLLDGARAAFVERGFYGARVEDICAHVGLTRGAFYSCFGKKEELFFALYDRMAAEVRTLFVEGLAETADRHQDPVDGLFRSLAQHYPLGRDWYVVNAEFTLFAIRNADVARILGEKRQALRRMIADNLDIALQRGGLWPALSLDLIVRALVGLADAGLGQSLIEPAALGSTTFIETFMAPLVRTLSMADDGVAEPGPPLTDVGHDRAADQEGQGPERLLAMAEAAFVRDGYGATRLSDIAKAAGMSKATIYGHFPSKAAMFETVVRAAIRRLPAEDELTVGAAGSGDEALCDFLFDYSRRCLSDDAVRMYRLVLSEEREFPALGQSYGDAMRKAALGPLTIWLEAQVAQGLVALRSPASGALMLIDMVMADPLRLAASGPGCRPDDDASRQRIREAAGMFWRAISLDLSCPPSGHKLSLKRF